MKARCHALPADNLELKRCGGWIQTTADVALVSCPLCLLQRRVPGIAEYHENPWSFEDGRQEVLRSREWLPPVGQGDANPADFFEAWSALSEARPEAAIDADSRPPGLPVPGYSAHRTECQSWQPCEDAVVGGEMLDMAWQTVLLSYRVWYRLRSQKASGVEQAARAGESPSGGGEGDPEQARGTQEANRPWQ
jgi:hypothetical protein